MRRSAMWFFGLVAVVEGLFFLDVFLTKLASGSALAYIAMVGSGGGGLAAALEARRLRRHDSTRS